MVVLSGVGGCYLGHPLCSGVGVRAPSPSPGLISLFPLPPRRSWSGRWKMEAATPRSQRGGGCDTVLLGGGALGTPIRGHPALNPPDFPSQGAAGSEGMSGAGDSGPLR